MSVTYQCVPRVFIRYTHIHNAPRHCTFSLANEMRRRWALEGLYVGRWVVFGGCHRGCILGRLWGEVVRLTLTSNRLRWMRWTDESRSRNSRTWRWRVEGKKGHRWTAKSDHDESVSTALTKMKTVVRSCDVDSWVATPNPLHEGPRDHLYVAMPPLVARTRRARTNRGYVERRRSCS